jgi:uncharacterized protein YcfJ
LACTSKEYIEMKMKPVPFVIAAALALAVNGCNASDGGKGAEYAQVISVVEVKEVVKRPREVCKEVVEEAAPAKDDKKILGTVAGAVVGGVLGHQVGGGRGKDLATVAGAVGGAYAGRKVQGNQQQKKAQPRVEKRCETVTDSKEKLVGYDVRYRLDGKEGTVRMKRKPGDRIPVKDGHLVLE